MKKFSVVLVLFFLSCSNVNDQLVLDSPEKFHVFITDFLKNINKKTRTDILENFISPSVIYEMYYEVDFDTIRSSDTYDSDIVDRRISTIIDNRNKYLNKCLDNIKGDAGVIGIMWDSIQYLDFTYERKPQNYLYGKEFYGTELYNNYDVYFSRIYYKYKDKPFNVKATFILKDSIYELYSVKGLYSK